MTTIQEQLALPYRAVPAQALVKETERELAASRGAGPPAVPPPAAVELLSRQLHELARDDLGAYLLAGVVSQGWTPREAQRHLRAVLGVPREWRAWADRRLAGAARQLKASLERGVCPAQLWRGTAPAGLGMDVWQVELPVGAGEAWRAAVPRDTYGLALGNGTYMVLGSFAELEQLTEQDLRTVHAGRITGNTPMVAPPAAEPR